MYSRTFFIALSLVGAIGTAAVYWVGGLLVIDGAIQPGTLVAFALLVGRVYEPLSALTNARVDVMTAFVSFERVFEVLDLPRSIDDRPDAVALGRPRRPHRASTTCRSPTRPPIRLDVGRHRGRAGRRRGHTGARSDVDLVVEPGTMLALVGPSGAGKTTLAALVPRLYDVTDGRGAASTATTCATLTQDSLRAAIGVVTQDPHLFHDTVVANLRYARPEASDAELVAACRAARIHDVIAALPDGYDTVVGERGLPAVGRREAAAGDRPGAAEGPGHRHPRRGDQPPRRRERGARAGRAGPTLSGPHRDRHRPPPVDHASAPTRSSCSTRAVSWSEVGIRSC